MTDNDSWLLTARTRIPWNKGKLTGAKPPLGPKHVWAIRTRLMIQGRTRDLAMFDVAIDRPVRAPGRRMDWWHRARSEAVRDAFVEKDEGDPDLPAHWKSSGRPAPARPHEKSRAPYAIWVSRSSTRSR